ncbi:MAG TPA: hypothetical protein VLE70_18370 [Anaerolineae bacterium]|nr:hypothetical protein [Anaerolineae bacterium]
MSFIIPISTRPCQVLYLPFDLVGIDLAHGSPYFFSSGIKQEKGRGELGVQTIGQGPVFTIVDIYLEDLD